MAVAVAVKLIIVDIANVVPTRASKGVYIKNYIELCLKYAAGYTSSIYTYFESSLNHYWHMYMYICMLNKNSLAVKKCEANQKPQWL